EKEKEIERLKAHIEQLQQQNKIVTPIIKQNQPSPKQVQTFNKDNTDNTYIEPQLVSIPNQSYQMAKYTVTFKEYDKYCKDRNKTKPDDRGWGRENRPAIYVSWNDAKEYAAWLSKKTNKTYRLPSEEEWEYCCKAGTTTKYSFGDDEKELDKYAWYDKNSYDKGSDHKDYGTHPVGEKLPNPWGLFDMHGNVWEWCEDWCDSDQDRKVLRGGSWVNGAGNLRSFIRNWFNPTVTFSDVGFRLVCEP
ncbi:MAG: formylglycine-generating enzyme family protein, partial [Campylobacterota bacterium]|nr:formylglycine-generating enzyme family protein [Campylobacterota bacterium]